VYSLPQLPSIMHSHGGECISFFTQLFFLWALCVEVLAIPDFSRINFFKGKQCM
jgi:hypothetical protein